MQCCVSQVIKGGPDAATVGMVELIPCKQTGTYFDKLGLAYCADHWVNRFTRTAAVADLKPGQETELGTVLEVIERDGSIVLRLNSFTTARYYTRPYAPTETVKVL